tara:strand:+ start:1159 stop:1431 length:273 start_codon:yes stop_codon:yes gene_type:complete
MATQLAVGTEFNPNMKNSNGQGVLQIVKGDTNVTLYGSVNGTDYALIETFDASTIKEIILCPYFKVSAATDGTFTTIGSSTVFIDETRSA